MDWLWEEYGPYILIVGAMVAALGVALWISATHPAGPDSCELAGGHWITKNTGGIGFTTGGKMAYVPSSVRFCISEDGRILE